MRGGEGEGAEPERAKAAEGSGRAMNYQQQLANSAAIRAEIRRFESVHPNIYSIYELLERVEEPVLQNQIREHVIAIEGEPAAGRGTGGGGVRPAPRTPASPWPCVRGTLWEQLPALCWLPPLSPSPRGRLGVCVCAMVWSPSVPPH